MNFVGQNRGLNTRLIQGQVFISEHLSMEVLKKTDIPNVYH